MQKLAFPQRLKPDYSARLKPPLSPGGEYIETRPRWRDLARKSVRITYNAGPPGCAVGHMAWLLSFVDIYLGLAFLGAVGLILLLVARVRYTPGPHCFRVW